MTTIARLEKLYAAASTGPWKLERGEHAGEDWPVCFCGNSGIDGQDYGVTIDRVRASEYDGDSSCDAAFIVAARRALPALLAVAKLANIVSARHNENISAVAMDALDEALKALDEVEL